MKSSSAMQFPSLSDVTVRGTELIKKKKKLDFKLNMIQFKDSLQAQIKKLKSFPFQEQMEVKIE